MNPQPTTPPIGRPILITISREARARSIRCHANCCALANALRDKFDIPNKGDAGVTQDRVRVTIDGQNFYAPTTIRAQRFIRRFDLGKPVRLPVTFRFTFSPKSKGTL